MYNRRNRKIAIVILVILVLISVIIIRNINNNKHADLIETVHYEKSILWRLGYNSLCHYCSDLDSSHLESLEDKKIYVDEMLNDPNLQSKLEIAFELLNADCNKYGCDKTFKPVTVDMIRDDLPEARKEIAAIFYYLSQQKENNVIDADAPVLFADYMKLAEEQLKESGDYIEWDEEFAGRSAYLNYWTKRIDEIESNPFKRIIQGKKLEGYKKRTIDRFLYTWEIESYDYEGICKEYEEIESSEDIENALTEFEKIMQEENPEIGYGTDYELITTDRLLNDYESVYDELTGEMSDKLDEKHETKYYISTIFCRALWGEQPDFLYEY